MNQQNEEGEGKGERRGKCVLEVWEGKARQEGERKACIRQGRSMQREGRREKGEIQKDEKKRQRKKINK